MLRQISYPKSRNCPRGKEELKAYLDDLDFATKYFDEELNHIKSHKRETKTVSSETSAIDKTKQEFETLVKTWKKATSHFSYTTQRIIHPAHLRIIGMGEKALPLILQEMNNYPSGNWFTALEAISGFDAAKDAHNIREAIHLWLEWGKQNQYL